ncbi:MAG: hypothetical protein EOP50_11755 [Sphingobacteriales bacterium]|nr:MAG: hypothetical protein EOP50_11755 [Sphingobacteriales bacterium]
MLTATFALALIGLLLIPVFLVFDYERRHRRAARRALQVEWAVLAARYSVQASAQELLPDAILACDAQGHRLLLVQRLPEGAVVHRFADLEDLSAPVLQGQGAGGTDALWLSVRHAGHTALRLCFYDPTRDDAGCREQRRRRAVLWVALLEQLCGSTRSARTV